MGGIPMIPHDIPLEVKLAWEVMTCRGMRSSYENEDHPCKWFNAHYGPYPAYDWIDELPTQSLDPGKERVIERVTCKGRKFQIPEIMSGCRKAPIMTIGINPNISAHWPGKEGAAWCYPYFDDIRQYAYYFRYRTVFQESFTWSFIEGNMRAVIRAKADGFVADVKKPKDTGQTILTVKYSDGTGQQITLCNQFRALQDFTRNKQFKKGDLLAFISDSPDGSETELLQKNVQYYERFHEIFTIFKSLAGPEFDDLKIGVPEDVCQADMIACASPGWSAFIPETIRNGIIDECISNRRWIGLQLLQTRPAVIVFAGKSAFRMFYDFFEKCITPKITPEEFEKMDEMEVLKRLATGQSDRYPGYCLNISLPASNLFLDTHLIISPHFSYAQNFEPQCRFTREEWDAFERQYPDTVMQLKDFIQKDPDFYNHKVITIKDPENPPVSGIPPEVRKILSEHFFDVKQYLAKVLLDEYRMGRIKLDPHTGHLVRTEGPCCFCDNVLFSFVEKCRYRKDPGEQRQDHELLELSRKLIKRMSI